MSSDCLQRKYIDLVYKISTKWANWDPPIGIKVGAYGSVDKETGTFLAQGNIYDPEFQNELDKQGIRIKLADYPPKEGQPEDDFTITSSGVKHLELNINNAVGVAGIANASIKGQWSIDGGKREAILIMQRPRLTFLPQNVILEHLYKVEILVNKWLVTNIQTCPAYSLYLSDKSASKVSLALVAQGPVGGVPGLTVSGGGGFSWWADIQGGLLRKACDQTGSYSFTPLFSLRRPLKRHWRLMRDDTEPDPTGDNLWCNAYPPWDPLDEDGEEEPLSPSISSVNLFQERAF